MARKASTLSPEKDLRLFEDLFFNLRSQESKQKSPKLTWDDALQFLLSQENWILGLDEVGRGCLAGPVCAGASAFKVTEEILSFAPDCRVMDSKKLSEEARQTTCDWIGTDSRFLCATAEASVEEIDEINILQASLLAMKRAYSEIREQISPTAKVWVLCDGNKAPVLDSATRIATVVKGDSKSFVIAAASILAKQYRDNLMCELSLKYPDYLWHKNVGYPTADHTTALESVGITPWHRKTFRWAGTPLGEYPSLL